MRLFLVVLSGLLLLSGLAYAQDSKVGYVDLRRVVTDSKKGKAAFAAVESQFGPKGKTLENNKKSLEAMEQDFIKNAAVMNEASRKQKAEQIDRMKKDFTRSLEDFQYELKKRDYELSQSILKDIEGILKSIGQSGGYTMILESSALVYGSPAADITDKVIQAYDAQ